MESRDFLRVWEQSTWPEDDFTVEDNRKDMVTLEGRHERGEAFTYTVLSPDETECLGCVYVIAPNARMYADARITPLGDESWADYDGAVYFWVRRSHLAGGTDLALLEALRTWFAGDWSLERVLFVTNEDFTQQVDLIEGTDLTARFRIEEAGKPSPYLAYA